MEGLVLNCSEWREVKVSDVIEMNPRLTLKKGTLAKKIAMKDLAEFNRKIQSYEITEFTSGTKFQNGDTLFARITPCLENGKTAYVDILEEGEVAFGSTEFIVLRAKTRITDDKFVYYLSISPDFRNVAIKSMTGSSGRQRVQNSVLANKSIKIPPLKEQKRIANILSSIDDKIELNNELNETLEEIAQAIFKHWFVDFEFPNENGEPYKSSGGKFVDSELGMIPEGWYCGRLTDIAQLIMGQSPKGDTYNFEGIGLGLVNGASDFKEGKITPLKYTTDPKRISQKGDWIFGVRATVGNVTYVDKDYCIGRGVGVARALYDEVREYLYFQLVNGINYLEKTALGSVYINLSKSDLENIKFAIPPKKILNRFHTIVSPLFNKIILNNVQNDNLTSIRDTLLPKLMSGEIRVPEAEEVVESCLQKSN